MVFSNVSQSIRLELCALDALDAQEAWQFLERTYGKDVPVKMRSVKGLRDIMGIRYDKCASLQEYIKKMVLCSRVIQCNRGEKDGGDGGKDRAKNRNHLRGGGDKRMAMVPVHPGESWSRVGVLGL